MTRLTIPTPTVFNFRSTVLSHGWLELKPFGHSEDYTTLYRVEQLSEGRVVRLSISSSDDQALLVQVDGDPLSDRQELEVRELVARIFHLELDLTSFYGRLEGLPRYDWVKACGAGRLLRSSTVWEDLAKTLLTTNTTWAMTRAMVARLTELGDPLDDDEHAFPSPQRIAQMSIDALSDHVRAGYRNDYLHALACSIAGGSVDVESWLDCTHTAGELFKQVRALKGFGPYAAGSVLKLLGHYDELAIDSAARSMFKRELLNGDDLKDAAIEAHYNPFGEWRGLVIWMDLMRMWTREQIELR